MAKRFLAIGEAMVELSAAQGTPDLWRLGFAGDTLNTSWYARAKLPATWEVAYFTRLGRDPFSPKMVAFMRENGINTDHIAFDDKRSVGLYSIELNEGERSFAYWRGQSAAKTLADDPEALKAAMAKADAIYFSGITLAILSPEGRAALIDAAKEARAAGKVTIFDPNLRPALWESREVMCDWLTRAGAAAAIVLPSYDDEAQHFGDPSLEACAERWQAAGAEEIIVKNGGGPIHLIGRDLAKTIEVTRATPLDSTGAGDSFNGGYLAARLEGASMEEAAAKGHALSVQVIAHPGALIAMDQIKG